MNKPYIVLALLLFSSLGLMVKAQQHVHGQGELLISQEGSTLHLQLVLPAADALGFEHEPETTEQIDSRNLLAERFELNLNVIEVEGQCELLSVAHTLEAHADSHDVHKLHDDHHEDAHKEEHEEHEEESHQNIEVEYQFECEKAVTRIAVALFESMPSLSAIKAQWITENDQGLTELSASRPALTW